MDYSTPIEMLLRYSANQPDKVVFNQPVNRKWKTTTWREAETISRRIAKGLLEQGFKPGDKIAILAKNSAEWYLADWAIMMAGMVSVPIYATARETTIQYTLQHSEAKAVFVGKLDDIGPTSKVLDGTILRISFPYPTAQADQEWNDWLTLYPPLEDIHFPKLNETMSIVYTSGSIGNPKGVLISYLNYAAVSETHKRWLGVVSSDRIVSYLPLAHITERGVIQGPGLYAGAEFYFVESLDTFIDDLKYANSTLFLSVPRLWAKFQTGVFEKLPAQKLERLLKIPLLGGLLARKIRKGLGFDSVRIWGSGSAPIAKTTLQWYQALGINISEGWGMTETTGLSCCNLPFNPNAIGTIGVPADCVEMKLSDAGEILIRGEAVFEGYYKDSEATQLSFEDGWFKTGDKARQLPDGSYQIIGRVKEAFKTSKGKYVSPVPIESMLASNLNIEQICVMGVGRKQPVAIVVLAQHLRTAEKEPIRESLEATLNMVNASLESHQKLDCLIIVGDEWTTENQLLTPTLKIRRNALEERYGVIAQRIQTNSVVWESEVSQ